MNLYRVSIRYDGCIEVRVFKNTIETKKTVKVKQNQFRARVFKKSEFEKVTDHGCLMVGQKAFYTLHKDRVPIGEKMIKDYFITVWNEEIRLLTEKINNCRNSETVVKEIKEEE